MRKSKLHATFELLTPCQTWWKQSAKIVQHDANLWSTFVNADTICEYVGEERRRQLCGKIAWSDAEVRKSCRSRKCCKLMFANCKNRLRYTREWYFQSHITSMSYSYIFSSPGSRIKAKLVVAKRFRPEQAGPFSAYLNLWKKITWAHEYRVRRKLDSKYQWILME